MKRLIHKIEKHLVDDWREAMRWASVWLTALVGMLATAQEYLPLMKEHLPEGWVKYATLAIIIARLWKQRSKNAA